MDDNEIKKIFWPVFLLVTGFSFILFNLALYWLEGTRQPVFNWIGITAIMTGSILGIFSSKEKSEKN